jgi:hypothetical protein
VFEHFTQPLLRPRHFYRRLARHAAFATVLIILSLALGTFGYHWLGELGWVDALLNASMILTGMGPVNPMHTTAAKLFAAAYALFSGVAFLSMAGVLFAPAVHRFLHRLHLDEQDIEGDSKRPSARPRARV